MAQRDPSSVLQISHVLMWWKGLRVSVSVLSRSVVSNSLQPHGVQPARLLPPWHFLGKNTGVGCHFLLQGIFLTQGLNLGLLHYRWILYR